MRAPVLIEPPENLPVSLAEAKAALDIDYTIKDEMIDLQIAAVTAWLDGYNGVLGGRCLCEQTWRQDFDAFDSCLRLPLLPVTSAVVRYTDADGVAQEVSDDDFEIGEDEKGAYIKFVSGFSVSSAVSVEFVAGYEKAGDVPVPANIKQAILLLVRGMFDNPSGVVVGASVEALPFGPRALLQSYVRMHV